VRLRDMKIVADTNAFLAVALDEPEKPEIIASTHGHELVAPEVLPFEIGNALTAMLKKGTLRAGQVTEAWDIVQTIHVELRKVDMPESLRLAARLGIYAYDAYFLECALSLNLPLLTLDRGMVHNAKRLGVEIVRLER